MAGKLLWFVSLQALLMVAIAVGVHWSSDAAGASANIPSSVPWLSVSEDDALTLYVYRVPGEGRMRGAWQLINFQHPSAREAEGSVIRHVEYDCETSRYRVLASTGYSGAMGHGKALWVRHEGEQWYEALEQVAHLICSPDSKEWI